MKIRNGFVSNSSSSSFMILGVKRKDMDYDAIENENLPSLYSLYVEGPDYDYITGIVIADVSSEDNYLKDQTYSFTQLREMAEKIAEELKVDISEVELITGTAPC